MYYCFCGPPSSRSVFVSRFGVDLLRDVVGDFQLVYANSSSELIKQLKQRDGRRSMLYFDFPDASISRIVVEQGVPTVFVSEPFENIVSYAMAAWKMDLHGGIRFATRSIVALYPIASSRTISPLRLHGRDETIEKLINTLALSLGLETSPGTVERIKALYSDVGSERVEDIILRRTEFVEAAAANLAALNPDERALLDALAKTYQPLLDGRPRERIVWPGTICANGDQRGQMMARTMDLTGPARILSFGPYLHLPAGEWTAEMRFQIADNWSKNELMMEITTGSDVLATGKSPLPTNGLFSMALPFMVTSGELPLEVRSTLMKGAIEGEFRLLDVVLTPGSVEQS